MEGLAPEDRLSDGIIYEQYEGDIMDQIKSETLANEQRYRLEMASYEGAYVRDDWQCPFCGEARMDYLFLHEEDSDCVSCNSCGKVYRID